MGGGDLPAVLAEQGEMDGGDAPVGDFHEWPVVSWRMSAWSLSGASGRNPGPAAGVGISYAGPMATTYCDFTTGPPRHGPYPHNHYGSPTACEDVTLTRLI